MSTANDPLPCVTVRITRPSDTATKPTTFPKGRPVVVEGNVHWEPKRPSYVGRIQLSLRIKNGNDVIEVASAETEIENRVAGGFSWSGALSTDTNFTGDGQIVAVAFDATSDSVGHKAVAVEIQANA